VHLSHFGRGLLNRGEGGSLPGLAQGRRGEAGPDQRIGGGIARRLHECESSGEAADHAGQKEQRVRRHEILERQCFRCGERRRETAGGISRQPGSELSGGSARRGVIALSLRQPAREQQGQSVRKQDLPKGVPAGGVTEGCHLIEGRVASEGIGEEPGRLGRCRGSVRTVEGDQHGARLGVAGQRPHQGQLRAALAGGHEVEHVGGDVGGEVEPQ